MRLLSNNMKAGIKKSIKQNIAVRMTAVVIACGLIVLGSFNFARADVATDSLTIRVGYSGMKLSEYVEVGNYHWRELRNALPLHKVAYSYFQSSSKKHYNAIVDSAQGFYITDLLDYANIYYGDVKSLKFYVEDSKGIRTTFDKGALFRSRYYYDDLAGHRTVVFGKKTVTEEVTETVHHEAEYETEKYTEIVHHDAEYRTEKYTEEVDGEEVEKERKILVKEAWDEEVEKEREVLVKEAWDEEVTSTVEKEVEDKSEIIEYTFDEAARYASQVQPMLAIEDNWAQFSEEFEHIGPDFSSMNAGNRFRLLFGQTSPTETLTSKSDKYVSCVYVTLDGKPTIGDMGELDGKYGSHTVEMTVSADNASIRDALSELMNINSTNTDVLTVTGIDVVPDSRYSDLATVIVHYEIVGDGEASLTVGVGSDGDSAIASKSVTVDKNKGKTGDEGNGSLDNNNNNKQEKSKTEEIKNEKEIKEAEKYSTYQLSDKAAQDLQEALMERNEIAPEDEDIRQLVIEDNSEKEREEQRRILALTGLGMLLIGAGGSAAEMLSFNMRLKGRKHLAEVFAKTR